MPTHISHSALETRAIAKDLAKTLQGGDIVILKGTLGAGKTAFTKGIAEGLGIEKEVMSPTFTLMSVYPVDHETIKELAHVDTYRLETYEELLEIGIEDYLGKPNTLTIIEWPEKIEKLLENKKVTLVTFISGPTTERTITIEKI
jgi:tRNA threonylcarbamoyladenosine biosynthesis protein TsaE